MIRVSNLSQPTRSRKPDARIKLHNLLLPGNVIYTSGRVPITGRAHVYTPGKSVSKYVSYVEVTLSLYGGA